MIEKGLTLSILLASISYLFEAQRLTFGSLGSPKSGFLPVLAGSLALILSLALFLSQCRFAEKVKHAAIDWTKFIFILIGLLFYITILTNIGYFTATLILLLYLFKVADTAGWIVPLLLAATSSVAFYLLFARYLAIPLP